MFVCVSGGGILNRASAPLQSPCQALRITEIHSTSKLCSLYLLLNDFFFHRIHAFSSLPKIYLPYSEVGPTDLNPIAYLRLSVPVKWCNCCSELSLVKEVKDFHFLSDTSCAIDYARSTRIALLISSSLPLCFTLFEVWQV